MVYTIFQEIDKFYKEKENSMQKKYNTSKNYMIKFEKNHQDQNYIYLFDKDKLILKAEYKLLGIYNLITFIWYWGFDITFVDKNLVDFQDDIHQFSEKLIEEYKKYDKKEADVLHYITSNRNFFVSPKNLKTVVNLGFKIVNGEFVFPVCYGSEGDACVYSEEQEGELLKRLEYIVITKIVHLGE